MIIDCHTHIFPRDIRDNRGAYFEGEPAFRMLYESSRSRLCGAEELIRAMDEEGVDRSVVFGFPWRNPDTFRRHNDYVLDSVVRYGSRLTGFCTFCPLSPGAPEEAERCLQAGLSGIGELAVYGTDLTGDVRAAFDPVAEVARAFDVPVMLHANEPVGRAYPGKCPMTLQSVYSFIRRFPRNRIILAHWGGGIFFYCLMKQQVREALQNTWFDTAASPYLYSQDMYAVAAGILGADRILFGSDFPLIRPGRYFREMRESGLADGDVQNICGGSAARLLGI